MIGSFETEQGQYVIFWWQSGKVKYRIYSDPNDLSTGGPVQEAFDLETNRGCRVIDDRNSGKWVATYFLDTVLKVKESGDQGETWQQVV